MKNQEGVATLRWAPFGEEATAFAFELQQSDTPGFDAESVRIRYRGADTGSVLTGLPEATHHFRVRALDETGNPAGPWSESVAVTVKFLERGRVILLLVIGGTVFVATLSTLFIGHWRQSRREPEAGTTPPGS